MRVLPMSMRSQADQREFVGQLGSGTCRDTGPWGAVCTQTRGHDYSCYDSALDVSFNYHWVNEADVPLEHHPYDCRCDECAEAGANGWA